MVFSRKSALAFGSAVVVLSTAATVAPAMSSATPAASRSAATSSVATAQTAAGKYTSQVFGAWPNGVVRGVFRPARSFVQNGRTVVQGSLVATLLRNDGVVVGKTTRNEVAIPVNARGARTAIAAQPQVAPAQATCQILHLVLGPLTLNLLGLQVTLNRVVLNITAIPGAGNLLGNLLCAVAHLLDSTSPSALSILQLASDLNRILGLLGL